ncbi:YopX family protein [uncultured Megasphaera sp.]
MDSWSDYVVFEVIGNRYENPELLKGNESDI